MPSRRKAQDVPSPPSFEQIRESIRARTARRPGELSARRRAIEEMLGRPVAPMGEVDED
jgi:hypothetical protein